MYGRNIYVGYSKVYGNKLSNEYVIFLNLITILVPN